MAKFKVINMPTLIKLSDKELLFVRNLGFDVIPVFDSFKQPKGFNIIGEGSIDIDSIDQLLKLINNRESITFKFSRGINLVSFEFFES